MKNKALLETVEKLLESKNISKGSESYGKMKKQLISYMESFDKGIHTLLEGDYETNPPKVISQDAFTKLAMSAHKVGKSNTIDKAKKTPDMSGDASEIKKVEDDVRVNPKGKDWHATPGTKPESKESVDKKAEVAKSVGNKNTVGKGSSQKDMDNKGMLESVMKEVILHDEYITFVESYKDGTKEVDTFVESVKQAFMESHGTLEKIDEVMALLESSEAVADLAGKVGDALKQAADKIAEGEEEATEVVNQVKEIVDPEEDQQI